EVKIGTQVYLASYSSDNWWGSMISAPLVTTGGVLSVSSVANWDAKCVLTGGPCAAMGTNASGNPTTSVPVQGPASRALLTSGEGAGLGTPFEWSSISSTQKAALNSTDNLGQQRLNWLRGDRSNEQLINASGKLRNRVAVLGDIIDSSPTWVGAPFANVYPDAFTDKYVGNSASIPENATGAEAYSTFVANNTGRENVVYVGSNDGFMHGFEAGSYNADGSYNSTTNDGKELLGFMPTGVLSSSIDQLTDPNYGHHYYVDATPASADLFYAKKWHTWLVGGVGTDGSEIYALDITDPSQFSESNASSLVIGDWTNANSGLSHLADTVGTPVIARLHNGQWAIIFGNGLNGTKSAGVYIGLVDPNSGAVSFMFLDTGVGSASNPDGIAYVSTADVDGDHIADYLYAGDTQGNVWRFDLTSKNSSQWSVSTFGNSQPTPLYVARDAMGTRQPITTAVTVAGVTTDNVNRVMVMFGTGQKTPLTSTSGDVYASGTQTFYGVWDWDMGTWNSKSGPNAQYAALTGKQSLDRSRLLQQSVVSTSTGTGNSQVVGYRTLSTTSKVCWQGTSTCSTGNNQFGWYFDLPAPMEQIIYNPTLIGGAVVVNSAIPPEISALQCNPGLQSGWTMSFDPATGGAVQRGFFPGLDGSFSNGSDGSAVSGVRLDAVGTPTTVKYNGQTYLVTQTVQGNAALSKVNPPNSVDATRVSWRELRN
ncbi:PilC/PilY family type IV pilus protein, partial [Oleiagrimonas sp.]|uniref:pilus assembly protein n=1 Tax=Oleiagrimonas sp. TaxID=2010330 RepID=UPI0026067B6A